MSESRLTAKMIQALNRRHVAPRGRTASRSPRRRRKPYDAKAALLASFEAAGIPCPTLEHRFSPPRRWRFDFCWPGHPEYLAASIALELEGASWAGGRHTRGKGYADDIEKYNEATLNGWVLIRCTPDQVKSGAALAWVKRALGVD